MSVALAACVGACGGDEGGKFIPGATTGEVVDTTPPTSGDDGADETGTPPPDPGTCFFVPGSGEGEGAIKHECSFEYDIGFAVDVDPDIGPDFFPEHGNTVLTTNESAYDHPFVAACCTDITEADGYPTVPLCELPHYNNCYRDLLDHICRLPGSWLEKFADDVISLPGTGHSALKQAAKEWRKPERIQECFDHFWTGPDDLDNADMCDVGADSFFVHTSFEPSFSISVAGSEVSNLELVLSSRAHDIFAPPTPPDGCVDLTSDDQAPPFAAVGSTGSFFYTTDVIPFDVDGPDWQQEPITGSGEFSPFSSIQPYTDGSGDLVIEWWGMVEDAPTTVGTSSVQADVDIFRLELMGEHVTSLDIGAYKVIDVGEATFDMTARIDGIGYNVAASNGTQIKFLSLAPGERSCPSWVGACWWQSAFTIEYEDSLQGAWTLDVPATTWVLPLTFAP